MDKIDQDFEYHLTRAKDSMKNLGRRERRQMAGAWMKPQLSSERPFCRREEMARNMEGEFGQQGCVPGRVHQLADEREAEDGEGEKEDEGFEVYSTENRGDSPGLVGEYGARGDEAWVGGRWRDRGGDPRELAADLLRQRKSPEDREVLRRLYDNLMMLIEREMKGETIDRITALLKNLEEDFAEDDALRQLPKSKRRDELLKRLLEMVVLKRAKVGRRENYLRRMENLVTGRCARVPPPQTSRNCPPSFNGAQNSTEYKTRTFYPRMRPTEEMLISDAKEKIREECEAEFQENVAAAREEMEMDLAWAEEDQRRASFRLEMGLRALNVARREAEIQKEKEREMKEFVYELREMRERSKMYCAMMAEQEVILRRRSEWVRQTLESRYREVDDLRSELYQKQQYRDHLMDQLNGIPKQPTIPCHRCYSGNEYSQYEYY